ncbi:MAG: anion permease [Saprospiraceae bacterium]|nr:MAG: anion permease [Saprospiraceae bacterium]
MKLIFLFSIPVLDNNQWFWLFVSAFVIGLAKAGVKGLSMIIVPFMAIAFGGRASAGLVLPMLSIADLFAVRYYNRDANWSYVWKLLPAAIIGVLIGMTVGYYIDDELFKKIMAVVVLASLGLMIVQQRRGLPTSITDSKVFGGIFGLLGGFSTMIGNAAGPVMAVYLLAINLPKNSFIGTGAWFFLIINLFKIPLHIFVWKSITLASFSLNLLSLPVIFLGVWLGIKIVKLIPEKSYRYFIIGITFLAALRLLF